MPRASRSRSILQTTARPDLSQDESVGVKCRWTRGCASRKASTFFVLCAERLSTMTWDLAPPRLGPHDVGQELDKRVAGVPGDGLADDFTGACVERGIQRESAVSVVFKAVAFGPPGRERHHRIQPVEGPALISQALRRSTLSPYPAVFWYSAFRSIGAGASNVL